MELACDKFVDHFEIPLYVQCLRRWPKRGRKSAPTWMSECSFERMRTRAGDIGATLQQFAQAADPILEELHQTTPKGQELDRRVVAGMIYDRLSVAGIAVRSRPPLRGHSIRNAPG